MQNVIFMSAVTACLHTLLVSAATNEFMIPENTGCVCSGTRLTYNCTITGMGSTEWSGTLFDCPANGIILRHERFPSEEVVGVCNEGDTVVARELGFSENCYTSELTFVANPSFNSKTVSCIHNANEGDIIIGTSVLTVEGNNYPPPENITLFRVYQRMLTFNWSLSIPNCAESSLSYGITFDCGSCPQTTNTTNVTCSDVQLPPNESSCRFIIHTIVCENAGLSRNSITVNIVAPDEPIAEIVPIYSSAEDRALIGIMIIVNQKDRFNSTVIDNMAGIVESYSTYIDSTMVANNASCSSDECRYTTYVSSSFCDSSSSVSGAIAAVNGVGRSPSTSNPSVIACTNKFVFIEYNSTTSTITCQFTSQSEGSQNTCSVRAGLCTALVQSVDSSRNTSSSANVTLHISEADSVDAYCLTATNGTYTLMIERHNIRNEAVGGPPIITIIVVCVVASVIILLAVAVILCWRCRKNNKDSEDGGSVEFKVLESQRFTKNDYRQLIQNGCLNPHDTNDSELIELSNDDDNCCSIKELLQKRELEYFRGHVYYEFSSDAECITKDKLLLFKTKSSKSDERYSFLSAGMNDKLHGECVLKPDLDDCLVFVQSTGSGLRCLPPHKKLIYERLNPHPMWRVDKDQYKMKKIQRGCSVEQYWKKGSVFVEYDLASYQSGELNTMFMITRKVQDKELCYTGSRTKGAFDSSFKAMDSPKVLTLMANECKEFKQDTVIWYQIPNVTIVEGVTLIPIEPGQFKRTTLKENLKLKEFQKQHNLHPNVLVEIRWEELNKHDKRKIEVLDTILMHSSNSKDQEKYFFCNFDMLLSHRQKLLSEGVQAEWKLFVMYNFDGNYQLQKNLSILYRAWEPNGLMRVPDHSAKHFTTELVLEGTTLNQFFASHRNLDRSKTDVFVNVSSEPGKAICHVRDVILVKKTAPTVLFSGPYARNLVKKWSSGGQESDVSELDQQSRDCWDIYVLGNDVDEKLTFTSRSSILYLKHDNLKRQFEVHEVEEDTIRLSQFLKKKGLQSHYGKVYYELVGDSKHAVEDFLYYKEVVLLNRPKKLGLSLRRASTKFPVHGIVECEFHSIYKVHKKIPHMEVKVKLDSNTKYFIQSLSQGSRCLKRGELVLTMKE